MIGFKSIITLFMLAEIFSAWGLWIIASVGMIYLARSVSTNIGDKPVESQKYMYLLFGIMIFVIAGIMLMWHSMSLEHTRGVREILTDAYAHPNLWGATP